MKENFRPDQTCLGRYGNPWIFASFKIISWIFYVVFLMYWICLMIVCYLIWLPESGHICTIPLSVLASMKWHDFILHERGWSLLVLYWVFLDPEGRSKKASKRNRSIYPAPGRGTGYWYIVFGRFLSFFLCFFVSNITRKWLDRFAWNFQGRCGVTVGRPD